MKKILTAIALALCTGISAMAQEQDLDAKYATEMLKPGVEAPDFTVIDAETMDDLPISTYRGKYVVLDFWATWCPDCRKDVPKMKELYGKYASDNVIFIGISFDKNDEVWMKYIRENGMEWLQHREQKPKNESQVSIDYHVKWIPSIYVIGPDGKIMLGTVMIEKLEKLLETIGK
jgi:thiol-disulfide isomerase/thioredoxin